MSESPFLGIVLATNRPQNICAFLENLNKTASDPASFEVLIRADTGDNATINAIESCRNKIKFRIYLLIEPNVKGPYQMHKAYNKLIMQYASPSCYFFCNWTDELRVKINGWDNILKKYIKYFDDDIFRLEISRNNVRNYDDLLDAIYFPDNYPLLTKKWLQIVGGWGDFWGTDSWQQSIDYYLGRFSTGKSPEGIFRSIPVMGIEIAGQEAGVGEEGKKLIKRENIIMQGVRTLVSPSGQENFARLSARIAAYVDAAERSMSNFVVKENLYDGVTELLDRNNMAVSAFYFRPQINSLSDESRKNLLERKIYLLLCKYFGRKITQKFVVILLYKKPWKRFTGRVISKSKNLWGKVSAKFWVLLGRSLGEIRGIKIQKFLGFINRIPGALLRRTIRFIKIAWRELNYLINGRGAQNNFISIENGEFSVSRNPAIAHKIDSIKA